MRVAVTGATGIVGRFVCEHLLAEGHTVRALCRPTSITSGYVRTPQWVVGELDDTTALQHLLEGMEAVVHCAFSHVAGRYRGGEGDDLQGFWRTNLGGTLRLLEISQHSQVQRVVLLSSRAVFAHRRPGEDPHTAIDDDHPLWPDTHYGALKAAEEALAGVYPATTVCALRPTGVYGLTYPVERSKWYNLVSDVVTGTPVTTSRTATEVHGSDVAAAITCLLASPADQIQGRGFNCSDITLSTRELVSEIAARTGVPAELPPVSPAVVNPMRCDTLRSLGWQPSGKARFNHTLNELVECILASRQ